MGFFILIWLVLGIGAYFIVKNHRDTYKYNEQAHDGIMGGRGKEIRPYYALRCLRGALLLLSIFLYFWTYHKGHEENTSVNIGFTNTGVNSFITGYALMIGMLEKLYGTGDVYMFSGMYFYLTKNGEYILLSGESLDSSIKNSLVDVTQKTNFTGYENLDTSTMVNYSQGEITNSNQGKNSDQIIIADNDERCPDYQHRYGNSCENNIKYPYVENGEGKTIWNGVDRDSLQIINCNTGYVAMKSTYGWACVLFSGDNIIVPILNNISGNNDSTILGLDLPNDCERGIVERVVDGDTIVINGKKIRLIGIDTPETKDPNRPVECYGPEASDQIEKLVENKKVCLAGDWKAGSVDQYNRSLKYVYLEDGTFINAEMLKGGYAEVYLNETYRFKDRFIELQDIAQEKKVGIRGSC